MHTYLAAFNDAGSSAWTHCTVSSIGSVASYISKEEDMKGHCDSNACE